MNTDKLSTAEKQEAASSKQLGENPRHNVRGDQANHFSHYSAATGRVIETERARGRACMEGTAVDGDFALLLVTEFAFANLCY